MKYLVAAVVLSLVVGCGKGDTAKDGEPAGSSKAETKEPAVVELGVSFTVDGGKRMKYWGANVSTSFREVGTHKEFKILAGAEDNPALVLTAISDMKGPSTTPSGAPEPESGIHQGSVSLQNVPEKGYTSNSFDTSSPETSKPVPDAVVITGITEDGKDARIVSGTFSATTFGTRGSKDPKETDHVVKGAFRIRHEFGGTSPDRF